MSSDLPRNENAYILDADSGAEMARLTKQDRMITEGMGGPFPERDDVSSMHNILDIACGPGGWVLDLAFEYSKTKVVGIDSSSSMVEYARAQAMAQELENASFTVMNALEPLAFPDHTFDLVNARFLVGFMPEKAWPELLKQCVRITRPGGVIRMTEFDEPGTTNSAAFEQWNALVFRATREAGFTSSPDGHNYGIMARLGRLMRDAGCQDIGRKAHVIDFSSGFDGHEAMYQNCLVAFKLVQPFLRKMQVATQEGMDELYQQMLIDIMSQEFCAVWSYLSVWGTTPL